MKRTGHWPADEAETFLRESTVPVRLACRTPNDDLWMLSLWYEWVGGEDRPELCCATSAAADVVRFLRANDDVAFEISTNDPPYRGVRGRGTASIEPDEEKTLLRSLLERYLGGTENELGSFLLDDDREEVRIRITPTRLHSWDYSGRMRDVVADDANNESNGDANDK
ncbi:pyridoxamine 5'-phosphate oxidase family protein [Halogeometricum borinquense]|uniref:Pyridoxamine 5'-phosphate oxidase family protein n=1 Tax=Halogeometricum borinquense TaxID=60847 RepID=A0A6C0UMM1_9EURY|nr:pyridoxamine 5'-phosphate oxidase family protein [Halogeometricum borinquense]QIB75823.1 pyridoxamine 5'-phosphate oxidase family protein [Halogeometricum borinquense]QIQ75594.1 pyridoxamine 5'-phosphate oxidase family protein [Halogeometricum borinquense]